MKGASWVELSNPMAIAGPKCEMSGMPQKAQNKEVVCLGEFYFELSSRLASDSTSVPSGNEGSVVRPCFSSSHEREPKECCEISIENEENDSEHEGNRGEIEGKENEKDVLAMFLSAAQAVCRSETFRDSSSVEAMEAEVSGRQYINDCAFEVSQPTWGTWCQGVSPEHPLETLVIPEGLPQVDPVQQDEANNERESLDRRHMSLELPEADSAARYETVGGNRVLIEKDVTFDLPAGLPTESATAAPIELSAELHGLYTESKTKRVASMFSTSFDEPNSHDKTNSIQYEESDLVTYGMGDTESLLFYDSSYHGAYDKIEQEVTAALFLNTDDAQYQGIKSFGKPDKLGNRSFSKPKELGETHLADNGNELLLSEDMSVISKGSQYLVENYAISKEAREVSGGEKRIPEARREIAEVLGDRHKLTGDKKSGYMRDIDKSHPSPIAGASHRVYEGVVSKDGVSNLGERYLQHAERALRSSITNQIVDKAELWLGKGHAQMVIELKPDILGRVHLKVSSEAGRVVAEIRAESAATKALIESGLADLKTALSEKGFSFDSITVSWNSGQGSGGTGLGGNGRSWFSELNDQGHHDHFEQAGAVTSPVSGEDSTSLPGACGVRAYLDYIA
ncbi:MAG TPA: flagellar hook-length control protein FliK [Bacillota bacterium]|nr:flagellar hook-length control protein FliK [Bacillota bacterium]